MRSHRLAYVAAFFGLVLLKAWHGPVLAQTPGGVAAEGSLSVELDRDSVPVGGVAELTLRYSLPEGGSLSGEPVPGGLEGVTVLGVEGDGDGTLRVRLLADRLDSWETEKIVLPYRDGEGRSAELHSGPVVLSVTSNLPQAEADSALRPLRDIIPVESPWPGYLFIAAGLLVLAVAAAVLWRLRRRHSADAQMPALPPHVYARRRIAELESRQLFEKGSVKEYYFRFSGIMRTYLGSLRNFPAAEYTTEEIARSIGEEDRSLLDILRRADLAKFADNRPTPALKKEELEAALAYIGETEKAFAANGDGGGSEESGK